MINRFQSQGIILLNSLIPLFIVIVIMVPKRRRGKNTEKMKIWFHRQTFIEVTSQKASNLHCFFRPQLLMQRSELQHRHFGVSLVAQMVKNLPAMQETQVQSLGEEDPLEKELAIHSSILAWRIPDRGAWRATVHGVTKSRAHLSN